MKRASPKHETTCEGLTHSWPCFLNDRLSPNQRVNPYLSKSVASVSINSTKLKAKWQPYPFQAFKDVGALS